MTATIYEVAKKSGFSIGTVSRVLNGSPLHTKATRAKVLRAINELDYQPYAMAQGLARRKTNAIGVVVPWFNGHSHTEVLSGIQRGLARHNYDLLLYGVNDLGEQHGILRRALQQRRVDGLILVFMKPTEALTATCKRRRLPVLWVDSQRRQFDSAVVNDQENAFEKIGYQTVARMMASLKNSPAPSARRLRPQHVSLKADLMMWEN